MPWHHQYPSRVLYTPDILGPLRCMPSRNDRATIFTCDQTGWGCLITNPTCLQSQSGAPWPYILWRQCVRSPFELDDGWRATLVITNLFVKIVSVQAIFAISFFSEHAILFPRTLQNIRGDIGYSKKNIWLTFCGHCVGYYYVTQKRRPLASVLYCEWLSDKSTDFNKFRYTTTFTPDSSKLAHVIHKVAPLFHISLVS